MIFASIHTVLLDDGLLQGRRDDEWQITDRGHYETISGWFGEHTFRIRYPSAIIIIINNTVGIVHPPLASRSLCFGWTKYCWIIPRSPPKRNVGWRLSNRSPNSGLHMLFGIKFSNCKFAKFIDCIGDLGQDPLFPCVCVEKSPQSYCDEFCIVFLFWSISIYYYYYSHHIFGWCLVMLCCWGPTTRANTTLMVVVTAAIIKEINGRQIIYLTAVSPADGDFLILSQSVVVLIILLYMAMMDHWMWNG